MRKKDTSNHPYRYKLHCSRTLFIWHCASQSLSVAYIGRGNQTFFFLSVYAARPRHQSVTSSRVPFRSDKDNGEYGTGYHTE